MCRSNDIECDDDDGIKGSDSFGFARLCVENEVPSWEAYEWGEWRTLRPATDSEVISALLSEVSVLRASGNDAEQFTALGRAAAKVLPDALKTQTIVAHNLDSDDAAGEMAQAAFAGLLTDSSTA